jgi:hypothetical protein
MVKKRGDRDTFDDASYVRDLEKDTLAHQVDLESVSEGLEVDPDKKIQPTPDEIAEEYTGDELGADSDTSDIDNRVSTLRDLEAAQTDAYRELYRFGFTLADVNSILGLESPDEEFSDEYGVRGQAAENSLTIDMFVRTRLKIKKDDDEKTRVRKSEEVLQVLGLFNQLITAMSDLDRIRVERQERARRG